MLLHVSFSFSFTHFFLLCYQQTARHDDCVVIVKEVSSSSVFHMLVCGSGSRNPVLLPLNSPPFPMDSWLLWCEGQQQQQQQQPGLSVVLVTVCGRERFVLLNFTRCCCICYGGVASGSGAQHSCQLPCPVLFLLQMDLEGVRSHGQLARHNHNHMIYVALASDFGRGCCGDYYERRCCC